MKLEELKENILNFPNKKEQNEPRLAIHSDEFRDSIIRKFKQLTAESFGDWLYKYDDGKSHFLLFDNYWETYISHPEGDNENVEDQLHQRSKQLAYKIKKTGFGVTEYKLVKQHWKSKENPQQRSWILQIFLKNPVPQARIGFD